MDKNKTVHECKILKANYIKSFKCNYMYTRQWPESNAIVKVPQGSVITGAKIISACTNPHTHLMIMWKCSEMKWVTEEQIAPDFPSNTVCSLLHT